MLLQTWCRRLTSLGGGINTTTCPCLPNITKCQHYCILTEKSKLTLFLSLFFLVIVEKTVCEYYESCILKSPRSPHLSAKTSQIVCHRYRKDALCVISSRFARQTVFLNIRLHLKKIPVKSSVEICIEHKKILQVRK